LAGVPVAISFFGEAPGLVSGVMQINFQIPANAQSGDRPIIVTVGSASSQTDSRGVGAVTVSVK
jgi:uncharacterized protein (TIGR03437 family)